jgi:aminoglycoside phosphotransferase (APT) family kinase protein
MEDVMIPQEKSAVVTRALREAFGVTEFEDIRIMTKGHSFALKFRIVVQGRPYLLRIIMRTNSMLGPTRHFTCMKAAAEAGLAPHVWYTSTEDQISIIDFVEEAPFPATEALVRIPALLRSLHAVSPFPEGVDYLDTSCMFLMHKGTAMEGFMKKFQEANILSKGESEELFGWHAQIAAVYPHHVPDMVSSHNDLFKPDNILFDGQRVWLVDWEAAFLNDRYADLAVAANLVVTNDSEERIYLQEYFGQPPDEYQLARFFLMQQVAHMFYAMGYLLLASSVKPIDWSETVPDFRDFHRRLWTGEVNLSDNQMKIDYGRVHWERLLQNVRQARFNEALRTVSDRHAPPQVGAAR